MPEIHESVWIAPGAQVYGRVRIGQGSSIWPYAVIRAECHQVSIGRMSNLQDFVMVHVGYDHPTRIGDFCSITHGATIHGCTIGDHCLVGVGATLMDGALIGHGSIVGGHCLVPEGKVFPPGSILVGVPARVIRQRDCARENRINAWQYHWNAQHYRQGRHRAWTGPDYEAWLAAKQREVEQDADLLPEASRISGRDPRETRREPEE